MEETKRKLPSFPPNYVTLVQLHERWMKQKEQQQKKNENENELQEQQKEESEVAVSVCVGSCFESESTEKKKNLRKGKCRKGWKVRAVDHQVNGGGGGGAGGETNAPGQASVEDVVAADPTVEIEGKFQGMSIDGGNEKFIRPRNRSFNRVKNASNHLHDREGRKTANAKTMVWVKKGENFGGAQNSN